MEEGSAELIFLPHYSKQKSVFFIFFLILGTLYWLIWRVVSNTQLRNEDMKQDSNIDFEEMFEYPADADL